VPKRIATATLSVLGILGLGLGVGALAGCLPGTNPGGHAWSLDKHVYASTVWEPKTVTVTDTVSGETLWVKEVPVGRQVVIRFFAGKAKGGDPKRPDQMAWAIANLNKSADGWDGRMDVPGAEWRMLSFDLRPAPEYPRTPAPVAEPAPLEPPPPADAEPESETETETETDG
jgi:hypothetical protein